MKIFPKDHDGKVLNLMKEKGADFSKEHCVEFFLYFPDKKSVNLAKKRIKKLGFEVEISKNVNYSDWRCLATAKMIPGYITLNRFRKTFEQLAEQLNGVYDGWGTLIE